MINVKIRTTPKNLAQTISDAPRLAKGPMTEAAAVYLVGNYRRGLRHYPKKRPLQKYVRTFKLRRGWLVEYSRTKTRVRNNVPYAPFVQGDNTQAWMHAGRWRTTSKVASDNEKGMTRAATLAMQRYLNEKGIGK